MFKSAVKFGPASVLGYLASAVSAIGGLIQLLSVNHVDTTSWRAFGLSAATLVLTNLGRQSQAKALIQRGDMHV